MKTVDNNLKYCIVKFVKFVKETLDINIPFKVKLVGNRSEDFKTYAFYDKSTGDMKVYIKNRGLADVLRSIAHEMVHHLQNQKNDLNIQHADIGGKIEDEANAVAGQLVKKFGYEYPQFSIYNKNCSVDTV